MIRVYARITIGVLIAISLFFLYYVLKLDYQYNFELFYPKKDSNTAFFQQFRQTFESDNDFIQIGISTSDGIFQKSFLHKIDSLTKSIEQLEHTVDVYSITNVQQQKILPLYPGIYKRTILRIEEEDNYPLDSAKIYNTPGLLNALVSESGKSVCILIRQEDFLDEKGCFELSDAVTSLVDKYGFEESHIAGRCLGLTTYVRLIRSEVSIFVGSSAALILLFLFISYRRFWGLWMPALVIGGSVLWTLGSMSLAGKPMDLISNVIPTMLLVIGISGVVHLLSRFLDNLRSGEEKNQALKNAMKEVGVATIFTSLTTMIGFLSLTTSNVQPVIDLGIYMTLGLIFALFLTYTLFPSLIILSKKLNVKNLPPTEFFWNKRLQLIEVFIKSNKKSILIGWIVLLAICIPGALSLKIDSFLQDGLQENHPQRKAFTFFEHEFSGSRPLELSINFQSADSAITLSKLNTIDSIQQYLENEMAVGNINSVNTIFKTANQLLHGGSLAFYKIPGAGSEFKKVSDFVVNNSKHFGLEKYYSASQNEWRIQGKMADNGSIILDKMQVEFEEFISKSFGKNITYIFTGAAEMMDNTHHLIAHNVFRGLMVAIALIAIIMGFLFRSATIVIISLIVNVIPLLITAGIMGYNNISMQLSTSIIFIISFGIAVDDSIHFLSKFRREIDLGSSVIDAVKATYMTTGKAIIVTTLILSGGFLTLSLSDFLGTHYLGLYVSITLFIAMIADLMILPAALLLFYKKK